MAIGTLNVKGVHVKVGGAWKRSKFAGKVPIFGGVWRDEDYVWIRTGGVWEKVFAAAQVDVTFDWNNINSVADPLNCFAGIRFYSNGTFRFRNADGTYGTTYGLLWGAASDIWIERTLGVGDTLDQDDIGTSRVRWSAADHLLYFWQTSVGSKSDTITFDFYDQSTGGTLLATVDATFTATVT